MAIKTTTYLTAAAAIGACLGVANANLPIIPGAEAPIAEPDVGAASAPEEATAAGPAAASTVTDPAALTAMDPPFTAYEGIDVIPPALSVMDIPDSGIVVADAVACATECAGVPGCNAASYYGDNPVDTWPGDLNCWLKTLTGCGLPADATPMPDMTFFIIGGADCVGQPTDAAPLSATGPVADPFGLGPAAAPVVGPVLDPLVGAPPPVLAPIPSEDVSVGPTESTGGLAPPTQAGDTLPAPSTSDAMHGVHAATAAAMIAVAGLVL